MKFINGDDFSYELSQESYSWHDFDQKTRHIIRCDSAENNRSGLYIDLVVTSEEVCLLNILEYILSF